VDHAERARLLGQALEWAIKHHAEASQPAPIIEEAVARVSAFRSEVTKESDRAVMIIAAIVLDAALEDLLKAAVLPARKKGKDGLFGSFRPLGSLSARIEAAYRLGLITEPVRRSLNLIREIRNWVAHNLPQADFGEVDKAGRVQQLVDWLGLESVFSRHESSDRTARQDFEFCVGALLLELGIETSHTTAPAHRSERGRLVGLLAGDRSSVLAFLEKLQAYVAEHMEESPRAEDTDPGTAGPDPERSEH
jgi:hypothetical protein